MSNNSSIFEFEFPGDTFTEPFPNYDIGTHIEKCRLMGGIYDTRVRRYDGLGSRDMHS